MHNIVARVARNFDFEIPKTSRFEVTSNSVKILKLKITFCNPEFGGLDDFQASSRKVILRTDRTTDDGRKIGK